MTSNEAIIFFVVGFLRAAAMTFAISVACYWGYDLVAILLVGAIGGVMTMKRMEGENG